MSSSPRFARSTITVLVDIRTIPRSRHNPQFNADALATALPALGLHYVHLKGLGGLRKPRFRLAEPGLAQHELPWLRRLHGER